MKADVILRPLDRHLCLSRRQNTSLPQTTQARDMRGKLWSLLPGVIYDATWNFVSIGDVVKDAEDTYRVVSRFFSTVTKQPTNCDADHMT